MRRLRLLSPRPPTLQCHVPLIACLSSLPSTRHATQGPGPFLKRCPTFLFSGKRETSQVPGQPTRQPCRALRLRGVTHVRPYNVSYAAFHFENSVGLRIVFLSKLDHAAWRHPVYASQLRSPSVHATLGSDGWPTVVGQAYNLPGCFRRFPLRHPST